MGNFAPKKSKIQKPLRPAKPMAPVKNVEMERVKPPKKS